jgi:hypothetical protein
MPEETRAFLEMVHSEAWWIRLIDDDLTQVERRRWHAHLRACEVCRAQLASMQKVDALLRSAPEPPSLSAEFTVVTVQRAMKRQQLRRLLSFLGGVLLVAVVSLVAFWSLGSVFSAVGRGIEAVISARQVLFRSLVHTFVGLILSWKTLLPFVLGLTVLAGLLVMPNGLLVTVAIAWLSSRRSRVVAVGT